ncbi:LacI family DNA-binding transcriptional regulator [Clostridium estertheticum]|uniref:LacI family transcriptional regulator n=1 Tax=Clostridium estertheticum subsp. estertheticum TaxID=1552 RepID=A0A1J0GCH7_9CLOT|nr:LacI family DNA-binding transcriptional regulator [Clostridium estertheticum]APC38987.1 LacI family transcriptional regulator [Clostridium estertheticum subsp. estertheticum]MBZ9615054.1 LacI family DNA-binding transcriptional regulator [Clostridium estertheticum subsp. laramiense]WAG74956.1 LacI family DNA-binding transcriptional regulator [Clostridium estertheticum]
MATIKDVAKIAEVTVTTVSRVLNNRGYISQITRDKVHEAMKQLDYQPNEIARSLFRRKSNLIGLIIPNVAHPFFAELTSYIEYYAYKAGYKILLCNSYQDSVKEKDYVEMLKRYQVDGIIMGSHTVDTSDYLSPTLPIVALDRTFTNNIPFVTSDNYHGGVLATNLLIDRGCKKIAHISGPLEINTPANKRYQAFMDVVLARKVNFVIKQTKLDIFDGYEKLAYKLFEDYPDIDGVFASSDMIAASIIHVANLVGKDITKDLKIVGYDDINIASLIVPSLTTIKQPIEAMGELAVKILIDLLEKKEVDIENILPVTLVERKTT